MVATPSRIGFVLQAVRVAVAETPEVTARHGALARKDSEPVETFFDNVEDAAIVAEGRQNLLSAERRKFNVTAAGLDEALRLPLAGPQLPQASYIDPLRSVTRDVLVAEVGFDFGTQRANFIVWG